MIIRASRVLALVAFAWACDGGDPADDKSGETDDSPAETDDTPDDTGDTDPVDTDETDDPGTGGEWPDTPSLYTYDATTYLHIVDVLTDDTDPVCCRDFGAISGDTDVDNALGDLLGAIGFLYDFQGAVDELIEGGDFVALLEHRGIPSTGDGTYDMAFFLGAYDTGTTDYDVAASGMGDFLVDPVSFVPGTGRPLYRFPGATVTGDQLEADGGSLSLGLDFLSGTLALTVRDVQLRGTIARDTGGVGLEDGELSGFVRVEDFYAAYNDLIDQSCGCLGLSGDLFTFDGTAWAGDCVSDPDLVCTLPDEEICQILAGDDLLGGQVCGLIPNIIVANADLNLDTGDTDREALSIGLLAQGVPGRIGGLISMP